MKRSLLAAALFPLALAQPSRAADSISILGLTPPGGTFPPAPGTVEATVRFALESAPFGQIAVFVSQISPAPGPGQTSPGGSFVPVWVESTGRKETETKARFSLNCSATSVRSGEVVQILAQLSQSQKSSGPLGPVLASTTRPVRYTFSCAPAGSPLQKPK